MRRLTLAGQIAVIVTLAVFLAQAINLGIMIQNRRTLLLGEAVGPAAHRLAFAAREPDRSAGPSSAKAALRAGKAHRREPKITAGFPAASDAQREKRAEALLATVFAQQSVAVPELRAVTVWEGKSRESVVLLAARLADGRWVSVRAEPQQPLLPLIWSLVLQALLIAAAVLIPTLLILRRVGGSLSRLALNAADFDPRDGAEPVAAEGPSDVRRLVEAINAMQSRITAMLRERDVMLGAIGHDLRTPLTALRLDAEGVSNPEQRALLIDHIERLHGELEQILWLARAGQSAAVADRVDLAALVRSAVAAHQPAVASGRIEPAIVAANHHAIGRAIANLIENALRYGEEPSVELIKEGRSAVVTVADRGPGLNVEECVKVIEPFHRCEPSRNPETGGHGLGLAIVDAIVKANGGKLALEPREGGGLNASIRLPCVTG